MQPSCNHGAGNSSRGTNSHSVFNLCASRRRSASRRRCDRRAAGRAICFGLLIVSYKVGQQVNQVIERAIAIGHGQPIG
jgi:hypothetical protein